MTFTVHVEHQIVGGKTVHEEFEGVEQAADPPVSKNIHLEFAGEKDSVKLNHGNVVLMQDDDA